MNEEEPFIDLMTLLVTWRNLVLHGYPPPADRRLGNVLMMDLGNTSVVVTDAPFLQCVPVDELVRIGFRSSLVLNGLEERHLNRGIGLSLGVLGVVCFQEGHLSSRYFP